MALQESFEGIGPRDLEVVQASQMEYSLAQIESQPRLPDTQAVQLIIDLAEAEEPHTPACIDEGRGIN